MYNALSKYPYFSWICFCRRIEIRISKRFKYHRVHWSAFHNSLDVETIYVSIHGRLDKETQCSHTVEYYLSLKKEGNPGISDNIDESWGLDAQWRQPVAGEHMLHDYTCMKSQMILVVKSPPANTGDTRDPGSIPGSGRSHGGGNGNPLQYSHLGNPMDRGAWWATIHGATKRETGLRDWAQVLKWKHLSILLKWLCT